LSFLKQQQHAAITFLATNKFPCDRILGFAEEKHYTVKSHECGQHQSGYCAILVASLVPHVHTCRAFS
jgi:hypothetical protein